MSGPDVKVISTWDPISCLGPEHSSFSKNKSPVFRFREDNVSCFLSVENLTCSKISNITIEEVLTPKYVFQERNSVQ